MKILYIGIDRAMRQSDKLLTQALHHSTQKEAVEKSRRYHEVANRSLLLSSVSSPLIQTNRKTRSALLAARSTILNLQDDSTKTDLADLSAQIDLHAYVFSQTDFERIYKDDFLYYDYLIQQEKCVYDQISKHFANGEQFIINVTDPRVNGHKIASAYNMDSVTNCSGLAQFKNGYLRSFYLKLELFDIYTKNYSARQIFVALDQKIRNDIHYINYFDCVQQAIEMVIKNVTFSDAYEKCTLLHVFYGKEANSLGIARAYALLMRYFNVSCSVVCGDNSKGHVLYWNCIYLTNRKETEGGGLFALSSANSAYYKKDGQKESLSTFVDISSTIVNRVGQHIPQYTICVDRQRICLEYRLYIEFIYPDTVTLHRIEDSVTTNVAVRDLLKNIALYLNELDPSVYTKCCDVFVKSGSMYRDTLSWIDKNWQVLMSMTLRYAPRFSLVNYVLPKTQVAAFSLVFQRTTNQDLFLYNYVLDDFYEADLLKIVAFVANFANSIRYLVIPLNTDRNMTDICNRFSESRLSQLFESILFQSSEYLDSCIFGYSEPAMLIVALFIHVPVLGKIPKLARRNRFTLEPELRYIYSYAVRCLINGQDECVIPYTHEITYEQLLHIFHCIELDYPELFYIPRFGITMRYDARQRETKILFPLPDVTVLQRYRYSLGKVYEALPYLDADDFTKEKCVLQFLITRYYESFAEDAGARSVYDCLVGKHLSPQALALSFASLCHQMRVSACTLSSKATGNCCNLVWLQGHCTVVDLFIQYRARLKTPSGYFYPTFSINIARKYYSLIDPSMRAQIPTEAVYTANFIFSKAAVENLYDPACLDKIKMAFEDQLKYFQEDMTVQLAHRGIDQQVFYNYMCRHMTFITAHLLQRHYKVHPCCFRFDCCKEMPVLLVQLRYEANFGVCEGNFDNLEHENQVKIATQVYLFICYNKAFVLLKLSRKTLSEFYKEQYSKYRFDTGIRKLLRPKIEERGEDFFVIPCYDEYCVLFLFLPRQQTSHY